MPLHFFLDGAADALLDGAAGAPADPEPTLAGPGDTVVLTGSEAHHAASVRRLRTSEPVTLGDGRGAWLSGECTAVSSREVEIRITARTDVPAAVPRVILVQALAKGDRDELAVQAATELGVDAIVPWQAARSIARWTTASSDRAKAEKGRVRWATIAREAAKQAHRAWVPPVGEMCTTHELVERAVAGCRMLVLEPAAATPLSGFDLHRGDRAGSRDLSDIVVVVGPEGGIAPDELAALEQAGASLVRLGETVLRTSTAGPAALAVISAALGRW